MGGASSKFEQTQWWNADGKLLLGDDKGENPMDSSTRTLSTATTTTTTLVPNQSPTSSLQLYDLIKNGTFASQRDFSIKDGSNQTVYVTKGVPGTLAWFDICTPSKTKEEEEKESEDKKTWGEEITEEFEDESSSSILPEEDALSATTPKESSLQAKLEASFSSLTGGDKAKTVKRDTSCLLRVQVDLNRRTWIVYRYNEPMFPGQAPAELDVRLGLDDPEDEVATTAETEKEDTEDEASKKKEPTVQLYKACCISMSWSRQLALVTRYGPPTKLQDFLLSDPSLPEVDASCNGSLNDSDIFGQAKNIAARRRNPQSPEEAAEEEAQKQAEKEEEEAAAEKKRQEKGAAVGETEDPWNSFDPETSLDPPPAASGGTMEKISQSVTAMFHNTPNDATTNDGDNKPTKAQLQQAAYQSSLEGVVDLNGPLLHCQEILSSGLLSSVNHQTCVVSKEEAVKLWMLDDDYKHGGNKKTPSKEGEETKDAAPTDKDKEDGVDEGGDDDDNDGDGSVSAEELLSNNNRNPDAPVEPLDKAVAYELKHHPPTETLKEMRKWWTRVHMGQTPPDSDEEDGDGKAASSWFASAFRKEGGGDEEATASANGTANGDDGRRAMLTKDKHENGEAGGAASWFTSFRKPKATTSKSSLNGSALGELQLAESEEGPDKKDDESNEDDVDTNKEAKESATEEASSIVTDTTAGASVDGSLASKDDDDKNKIYGSSNGVPTTTNEEGTDDEPLVAYWQWKNTYKTHKMQMHLAQHSDLSLHVALAIIVNIVRYERGALAVSM